VLVSPAVLTELRRFVWHTLWTDPFKPHGDENMKAKQSLGGGALPLIIFFDADGKEVGRLPREDATNFKITEEQMLEALQKIR
jgi:hypothetical protein